ncbi:hypothetical protein FOFC_06022, partial [Fusarium oxysporum]
HSKSYLTRQRTRFSIQMSCHHAFQEVVDDLRWSYCSSSPSFLEPCQFNSESSFNNQHWKQLRLSSAI